MSSSDAIVSYRGTVYPWHCDHMGHMNVMWYVGKFDEALWSFLAELGLGHGRLKARGRGMAAVQQVIQYQRELLAGDVVEIRCRIEGLRDKVLQISQQMVHVEQGHVAASLELTAVHLDSQARRAVAFDDELRATLLARFPALT